MEQYYNRHPFPVKAYRLLQFVWQRSNCWHSTDLCHYIICTESSTQLCMVTFTPDISNVAASHCTPPLWPAHHGVSSLGNYYGRPMLFLDCLAAGCAGTADKHIWKCCSKPSLLTPLTVTWYATEIKTCNRSDIQDG